MIFYFRGFFCRRHFFCVLLSAAICVLSRTLKHLLLHLKKYFGSNSNYMSNNSHKCTKTKQVLQPKLSIAFRLSEPLVISSIQMNSSHCTSLMTLPWLHGLVGLVGILPWHTCIDRIGIIVLDKTTVEHKSNNCVIFLFDLK